MAEEYSEEGNRGGYDCHRHFGVGPNEELGAEGTLVYTRLIFVEGFGREWWNSEEKDEHT